MYEVALLGRNSQILSDVLSALLHRNIAVNAMVDYPEHLMMNDVDLTVSHLDTGDKEALKNSLEGYREVILAFSDDQTDIEANDFALRYYAEMVTAAREAGVKRLIVVGSPNATAYFMGDLRRQDGLDWVFISTEGDFADRTAREITNPHFHCEEYTEEYA